MECIKLITSGQYAEKRVGYLGLMVLLDEKQEGPALPSSCCPVTGLLPPGLQIECCLVGAGAFG